VTDDGSAEGRGDYRITIEITQFVSQLPTNPGGDLRMLKKKCALEILAAMQTGTQDEMTIEQRAGLVEEGEKIFDHRARSTPRCRSFRHR
jgi:hypothetical protein